MQSVKIEPGCISCGSCEFIAPEVFKVMVTSQVNSGVDLQQYKDRIRLAAAKCPVQVIKIEESNINYQGNLGVPIQSKTEYGAKE
jgi:ferredoxin